MQLLSLPTGSSDDDDDDVGEMQPNPEHEHAGPVRDPLQGMSFSQQSY